MRKFLACSLPLVSGLVCAEVLAADVVIDPTQAQVAISPTIYGANQVDGSSVTFPAWRSGGNRLTGYNWENNFSNAGSDWQHSSDTYLCDDDVACAEPGATVTLFVEAAHSDGAYPLVTLQMAGYVAADDGGTVTEEAPSSRWEEVVARKGSAFSTTPDPSDGFVYMDELVAFLVGRYGAASEGGIAGYALDNEPDLWSSTHPFIHPEPVGAVELVERSVELASAVKAVDPGAEVFGFVSYGYSGFVSLQDAPDWESVRGNYDWYVQYYLAQMAAAAGARGSRLLDVIDLHYYSEARGNNVRVQEGTTQNAGARVQSTRSLWDASYGYSEADPEAGENSWILEWGDPIELIPRVKRYIRDLYPDTKLAITEYDFGAAEHVSGGIAQADALGIFGREGVYFAARWGDPGSYTDAAYQLYLDYDGQGSHFGDVSVSATSSDVVKVPVYASVDRENPNRLHVVLINRDLAANQTASVTIAGSSTYGSGHVWGFDGSGASLADRGAVTVTDNAFSLDLPALSALHVVLTTEDPPPIVGATGGAGGSTPGATGGTGGSTPGATGGAGGTAGFGGGATGPSGGAVGSPAAGGTAASPGAGTTGAAPAGGSAPVETDDGDDGGCGCRLSSRGGPASSILMLAAAVGLALRRWRRTPPG